MPAAEKAGQLPRAAEKQSNFPCMAIGDVGNVGSSDPHDLLGSVGSSSPHTHSLRRRRVFLLLLLRLYQSQGGQMRLH
eukprot:7378626-Prymnesium_polylepis.1